VAVGDRISAEGTLNADGSLNATVVQSGPNDQPGFGGGGRGFGGGFGGRGSRGWGGVPSPAPSAATSGSST
jgi:hypothetical protein